MPAPSSTPFPTRFLPSLLLVAVAGGALVFWLTRGDSGPPPPTRLVEAVLPLPPEPLPPLLPGVLGVTDLLRDADGWWLLDFRQRRVMRLDPDLQPLFHFGGRGSAPGEFSSPRSLARFADTLVVLDAESTPVLHLFTLDGTFQRLERPVLEGCVALQASGLVSRGEERPLLLAECLREGPAHRLFPVVAFDARWEPYTVASDARPDLPVLSTQVATVGEDGRLLRGHVYDPCLAWWEVGASRIPEGGALRSSRSPDSVEEPRASLCLEPWTGVRVNWDVAFGQMGRAPLPGLEKVDWLPVMDGIFPHRDGVVFRVFTGENSRSLLLLGSGGQVRTLASRLPETAWVVGDEIVVAWTGMEGMHLERRSIGREGEESPGPEPEG